MGLERAIEHDEWPLRVLVEDPATGELQECEVAESATPVCCGRFHVDAE
jgi:hypothetical protein